MSFGDGASQPAAITRVFQGIPGAEPDSRWKIFRGFMHRINVRPERVDLQLSRVELRKPLLGADLPLPEGEEEPSKVITLEIPVRLYRTGHDLRLIIKQRARGG